MLARAIKRVTLATKYNYGMLTAQFLNGAVLLWKWEGTAVQEAVFPYTVLLLVKRTYSTPSGNYYPQKFCRFICS